MKGIILTLRNRDGYGTDRILLNTDRIESIQEERDVMQPRERMEYSNVRLILGNGGYSVTEKFEDIVKKLEEQ